MRLDKKATSISLLVALGVREDGQKVLLAVKNMGGESEAAWRTLLDDLVRRGLKTPELVIVDGAAGLEKALAALWSNMPVQRCRVHKHRNLLAHAPERLHEEISNDYKDMIYAGTKQEIATKHKAFIRTWRLKCKAVAESLEEADDPVIAALAIGVLSGGTQTFAQTQNKIWTEQGPGPILNEGATALPDMMSPTAGAINAIAPSPNSPDLVFVGTVSGGVWKTSNATAAAPTWIPLTAAASDQVSGDGQAKAASLLPAPQQKTCRRRRHLA